MATKAELRITAKDETASAFASASRRLDALGQAVPGLVGKLGGIGAALTAGLGALQTINVIGVLDQLDDLAEKTGIGAKSLSELRFASEVAGTSFESMATGVGQLAKRLEDAARGGKENGELFKRLGVSIKDSSGNVRGAEDVLGDLAEVFARLPDGTEKAALAQQLFGRSGLDLIPILNRGREGLAGLREEARQLGVVYSDDLAKAAGAFNDNLKRTTLLTEGLAVQIGGPLVEGWNRLLDSMLANTRQLGLFRGLLGTLGGAAAQRLGLDEMGQTKSKLAGITAEIDRVSNVLAGLENVLQREPGNEAAQRRYDKLRDTLRQLRTQSVETTSQLSVQAAVLANDLILDPRDALAKRSRTPQAGRASGDGGDKKDKKKPDLPSPPVMDRPLVPDFAQRALDRIAGTDAVKLADLNAELRALLETRERFPSAQVDEAIGRVFDEIQRLQPVPTEVLARQERLNELLAATPSRQLEATRRDMLLLVDALQSGQINAEQYQEAVIEALSLSADEAKKLDTFTEQAARNIQDALGDTLSDTLSGDWDNIGQRWQRLVFDMAAQALAADLGNKLLGDFSKTGQIGGALGSILSDGASWLGSLFGPGRARGGPVWPGTLHEVTEGGRPEMFSDGVRQWLMSPTGGQVTPLAATGGNTTIVNNVAAGVQRNEVLSLLQAAMSSIDGRIDARLKARGLA